MIFWTIIYYKSKNLYIFEATEKYGVKSEETLVKAERNLNDFLVVGLLCKMLTTDFLSVKYDFFVNSHICCHCLLTNICTFHTIYLSTYFVASYCSQLYRSCWYNYCFSGPADCVKTEFIEDYDCKTRFNFTESASFAG